MSYEWHSHILALLVLFPRSVKESWLLGWKQVHACSQRDTASSKTVREARDKRGEVTALSRGDGIGSPSSATFLILPSLEWVVCHHELQEKQCNSSQLLARIPRWSMDGNIHPSIMRCIAMRHLSSQLLSLARGVEMWWWEQERPNLFFSGLFRQPPLAMIWTSCCSVIWWGISGRHHVLSSQWGPKVVENSLSMFQSPVVAHSTSLCYGKDMLQKPKVVLGLIMAE